MTTKCSCGESHNVAALLPPFQKGLPLTVGLAKKKKYLAAQLKAELIDFLKKIARMFPIPASRNKMMDTF